MQTYEHEKCVNVPFSCPKYIRDYLVSKSKSEDVPISAYIRRGLKKIFGEDLDWVKTKLEKIETNNGKTL